MGFMFGFVVLLDCVKDGFWCKGWWIRVVFSWLSCFKRLFFRFEYVLVIVDVVVGYRVFLSCDVMCLFVFVSFIWLMCLLLGFVVIIIRLFFFI